MQKLNLPEYSFRIQTIKGKDYIFDALRKKFIRLTPEEWVRQNFVKFLISEKKYSPALLAIETVVVVNSNSQRTDLVIYDRKGNATMVVEFKAPEIKIDQSVFDQIVRYNMQLKVPFLLVSNGLHHYCCCINYTDHSYQFLDDIPDYSVLISNG